MNRSDFIIISCLLVLFSICFVPQHGLLAKNAKTQSIAKTAAPRYRPRVVYFYTTWCGVCQRYGPILKSTVYSYRNYVDFQSFNVDDPHNSELVGRFQIHSIPVTYIYNSKGQRVFAQTGSVDQKSLYNVLRSVYMEAAANRN